MKQFFFSFLVLAFFANMAGAAETTTDCPWMSESTVRNNPKANVPAGQTKKPAQQVRGASAQ